jgi:AraC-like DNA-binding protein
MVRWCDTLGNTSCTRSVDHTNPKRESEGKRNPRWRFALVCGGCYLELNHARVGEVLRVSPVSRRLLERIFRKVLSYGISDEIRRVHVERAKMLLTGIDLAVFAMVGGAYFSDANHLSTTSSSATVAQCQTKV